MSLNDIQLPASVIAALYPHSLVEGDGEKNAYKEPSAPVATQEAVPAVQETGWKHLGNNGKLILIAVNYPDSTYLPDEDLNFLTKMLTACKLGLADVAIVNIHHQKNAVAKDYLDRFKSKTVFLFGIDPVSFGLPVNFPQYQVQTVVHTTYLYSPSLDAIIKDELLKSKLWISLKRIFGI